MSDRTVHASYPGMEIVRYDRAGKWYLEPTDGASRRKVSFDLAVAYAGRATIEGGKVYFGRPGGARFDAEVRRV